MSKKENPVIELRDVQKCFGMGDCVFTALKDADLKVFDNDFIAVVGPSGSGKSTLLNMMGLLDEPTGGEIIIDGIKTAHMNSDQRARVRRERIGFVFQTFNLIQTLSSVENVEVPMMIAGLSREKRRKKATKILEDLGLGDKLDNLPSQLSGGQRQRVAIARALANDPEVILADEPTGNLDSQTGKDVLDIFKKLHKEEGRTLVIITHDEYVARVAEKRLRIKDGVLHDGE
ncbi:ABC transporter ATP-binding protein [Candidatus Micrarchaeota archaeon]|nr:ABC transporter ATP-binding protein [Candidatus Micrarchaeota archaeon]